jgi:hypothetical protein
MIVESMNDREFVLEVVRDFFDEMRDYIVNMMGKVASISDAHNQRNGLLGLV